jgi:hypothetical protein
MVLTTFGNPSLLAKLGFSIYNDKELKLAYAKTKGNLYA